MSETSLKLLQYHFYDKRAFKSDDQNTWSNLSLLKNVTLGAGAVAGSRKLQSVAAERSLNAAAVRDTVEGIALRQKIFDRAHSVGVATHLTPDLPPLLLQNEPGGGTFYLSKPWLKDPNNSSYLKSLGINNAKEGFIQSVNRGDFAAHELGHALHTQGLGSSRLATALHRLYQHKSGLFNIQNPRAMTAMGAAALGAGIYSGYKAGRNEESAASDMLPALVPVVVTAPMMGSEISASVKGYQELKNLGASAKYLKNTRRNLFTALGTYAAVPAALAGIGYMNRAFTKRYTESANSK